MAVAPAKKINGFSFTQAVIEDAIDNMDHDASLTGHDIPALILKECKNVIFYPAFLIWKVSFESEDSKYIFHL